LRREERLRGQDFSTLEITRQAQPGRLIEFVLSSASAEAKK
jgi:hypothetical protein